MGKPLIKEKVRIELRKGLSFLLHSLEGKYVSAQHRIHNGKEGKIFIVFDEGLAIQSVDNGENWEKYEGLKNWPNCNRGLFYVHNHWVAIESGVKLRRSYDNGRTWPVIEKITTPDDIHFRGLGRPNIFSTILTSNGTIVMVADNFLGQEGPDGQVICSIVSKDAGHTWEVSRLFAPADPLPNGPEGFGEPAVVEMPSNGWLWMVMRTLYGELWQCISRDSGLTWNDPTPTGLASPIANCYAYRIPKSSGIVLCWNLTKPGSINDFRARTSLYRPRTNLVFAVSHDNCRTWSCPVTVEKLSGLYPTIHFNETTMFIMYQSSKDDSAEAWEDYGLTLVTYDKEEVDSLPAWTTETIQPFIDDGLVAHWLSLACIKETKISIS